MFYFADLNLTLIYSAHCAPAKCVVPIVTHAYEECASERGKTLARFPKSRARKPQLRSATPDRPNPARRPPSLCFRHPIVRATNTQRNNQPKQDNMERFLPEEGSAQGRQDRQDKRQAQTVNRRISRRRDCYPVAQRSCIGQNFHQIIPFRPFCNDITSDSIQQQIHHVMPHPSRQDIRSRVPDKIDTIYACFSN